MGSSTILRGFKVSVAVLDAFLAANGVDETYGTPPFYQHHPDKDPISVLLYDKITAAGGTADKDKFRVMIPSREGHNLSPVAYVTYAWVTVYAHRELRLDDDLPVEVPAGFEELRNEILSVGDGIVDSDKVADEGRMGLFIVYTHDIRGLYIPKECIERSKVSVLYIPLSLSHFPPVDPSVLMLTLFFLQRFLNIVTSVMRFSMIRLGHLPRDRHTALQFMGPQRVQIRFQKHRGLRRPSRVI